MLRRSYLIIVTYLLSCCFSCCASAQIISSFDFEGPNDPPQSSGFSNNLAIMANPNSLSNGVNNSEAIEFTITGTNNTAGFAGGRFGLFDLTVNPLFTPGMITLAELDTLVISFDAAVVGLDVPGIRVEADGGFGEHIDLPGSTVSGSSFQSFEYEFVNLDVTQKNALLGRLNNQPAGEANLNLAFDFGRIGDDVFQIGDSVRFDNFTLRSVPEPSTFFVLGLGAIALGSRRRKR